jgi:hypothetical protein
VLYYPGRRRNGDPDAECIATTWNTSRSWSQHLRYAGFLFPSAHVSRQGRLKDRALARPFLMHLTNSAFITRIRGLTRAGVCNVKQSSLQSAGQVVRAAEARRPALNRRPLDGCLGDPCRGRTGTTTDMGRRAGVKRRPCHLRMGQPGSRDGLSPAVEHIDGVEGTRGTETSHVP